MGNDEQLLPLCDFSSSDSAAAWYPVNDVVMGGGSIGNMFRTEHATGLFTGMVSLENYGGFASVRTNLDPNDLRRYTGIAVDCHGDGKTYKLNLKNDPSFDGMQYQASFISPPEGWSQVRIPFEAFVPTFRGRVLTGAPALDRTRIRSLGLMISDKQPGRFRLEVRAIGGYR